MDVAAKMLADEDMAAFHKMKFVVDSHGKVLEGFYKMWSDGTV